MADNVSDELAAAIECVDAQPDYASPYDKEGFIESYYTEANEKYDEGEAMIEDGQKDLGKGLLERPALLLDVFFIRRF